MRRIVFDSSSDEEEGGEQLTPSTSAGTSSPLKHFYGLSVTFAIDTKRKRKLSLSIVECSQYLGICALPGCRYRNVRRSLQRDVEELKNQGVQNVFVFLTRGELSKYRVPSLLEVYDEHGFTVHHAPFPDGDVPELEQCCQILDQLQVCLERNRKTVVHCYRGLGRSALIVACLLLHLSATMTADKAVAILTEHRGGGAIQTVKQYNFIQEFKEKYAAYKESREAPTERSVSR